MVRAILLIDQRTAVRGDLVVIDALRNAHDRPAVGNEEVQEVVGNGAVKLIECSDWQFGRLTLAAWKVGNERIVFDTAVEGDDLESDLALVEKAANRALAVAHNPTDVRHDFRYASGVYVPLWDCELTRSANRELTLGKSP